jgi:hypothetical protein
VNNWEKKGKNKSVLVISFLLSTLRSHFAQPVIGTALASLIELFVEPKLKKMPSLVKWSRAKQGLSSLNLSPNFTIKKKIPITSKYRYMHGVRNVDEI